MHAHHLAATPLAGRQSGLLLRLASSLAEMASLAVFIGMIWMWAALASAPGV